MSVATEVPPLYVTPVSDADIGRGDGPLIAAFIEKVCRVTKAYIDGSRGDLICLMPWQTFTLDRVFARRRDGKFRHREALIGVPRKNGKSELVSAIAIYCLLYLPPGSDIVVAAKDTKQAGIVFEAAKEMISLDPSLGKRIHPYKYALLNPKNGNTFRVLASDAPSLEGLNCSVVIIDELHAHPSRALYDVLSKSQASRPNPMLLTITTAGLRTESRTGEDTICYKRFQYGCKVATGEVKNPNFFMAWWGAPNDDDYRDPETWQRANPSFGILQDPEYFEDEITKSDESDFRTKHLNQWVSSARAWLPQGAWAKCRTDDPFTPGDLGVVLGFDGSRNNDNTALVAVTIAAEPQIKVLGLWQRPDRYDPGYHNWKVPRAEVKDAIRQACRDYHVVEIAADPSLWQDALEELAEEGLPVVEFPPSHSRMEPATQRFFEMAVTLKLKHDGNLSLARHIEHTTIKNGMPYKESHSSMRKIDLTVASIMAVHRAAFWFNEPGPGTWNGHKVEDLTFVWLIGSHPNSSVMTAA